MVVLAVVIRARIDDDGSGGGGGGSDDGDSFVVACASELAAACRSLQDDSGVEVVVEPAGRTADAVANDDPAFDAWLVPQPWPAMADLGRGQGQAPVFADPGPVVARSPLLVVAVREDRGSAAPCQERRASWRCVGDSASGGARVIWLDPATSATGALQLGAVTVGFLGSTSISTNDFTDEFLLWRNRLLDEAAVQTEPVLTLLRSPAFAELAVATEAEWRTVTDDAAPARLEPLQFIYPEPVVTADVVLAPVGGRTLPRELRSKASRALADAGWRVDGDSPGAAEPELPASSNLPSAGVLVALRQAVR